MIKTQQILLTLLIVNFLFLGCSQDKSQYEWEQVNSGTDAHLYGVNFVDGKLGWVAGTNGVVLSTKDGGNTWNASDTKTSLKDTLTQVNFTTPTNGWLVSIGKVNYTGSAGNSWTVQHQVRGVGDKSPGILDQYFVSTTEGWAVGGFGTILHTLNGGRKWEEIKAHSDKHLWGVYFADSKHGWIVGEEGEILHTQDGGKNWVSQHSDVEQPLFAVHFANLTNGWIVGTNGLILITIDGGQTWERQNNPMKQSLRDVAFSNEKIGWAVGEEGLILHTTDGGINWIRSASHTSHNLQNIHLYKNKGWIAGEKGTILKMD